MKYIAVDSQQQLTFAQQDKPVANENQCLIKIKAIGVNRADLLQRAGKYPAPKGESEILGLEVSGEVVECGSNVKEWKQGDRIFGLVAGGGYAEHVVINADHMMKLPEAFDFVNGAGIAETFLTAYQSLFHIGQLKAHQSVLIHAGASGIGTSAIQLAKAIGCYVVVTAGNDAKVTVCLKLGADVALNYQKQDFVTWAKEHHKKGFNVIVDVVAGDYLNKNINVSALDVHIVILSMLGGRFAEQVDIAKMLHKRVNISASTLRNRSDEYKSVLVKSFIEDFGEKLQKKQISPIIDSVHHWSKAAQAHNIMAENGNIGKLILKIEE